LGFTALRNKDGLVLKHDWVGQEVFVKSCVCRDSSGGGTTLLNDLILFDASTNFTPRMTSATQSKPLPARPSREATGSTDPRSGF
jgi:hypothetical protein